MHKGIIAIVVLFAAWILWGLCKPGPIWISPEEMQASMDRMRELAVVEPDR